jgi:maleate isomerase
MKEDGMDDPIGWRARVGVLLPSNNSVLEPWLYHVSPPGVSFHSARMSLGQGGGIEAIKKMSDDSARAAREVASIPVDVIAYCCTASTLIMGPDHDRELVSKLESETGIPSTTTTACLLKALEVQGVQRISLISPYTREVEELEVKYFSQCGYEVLGAKGMNLGLHELDRPSPPEIYRFARKGLHDQADCLLMSCSNFRAQGCIEALERDIGKPVITSAQAILWWVLQMAGIRESIQGCGKLLE